MHPKKLLTGILFCVFLNLSAAAQNSYAVYLDNYLLSSDCVPGDIVKSIQTITLTSVEENTTTMIAIKHGTVYIPGIPKVGLIGGGGILDQTARSYFQQATGKKVIIELTYSLKGITGIYSTSFSIF